MFICCKRPKTFGGQKTNKSICWMETSEFVIFRPSAIVSNFSNKISSYSSPFFKEIKDINTNESSRFAFNMRYVGDEMRKRKNDTRGKKQKLLFLLSRWVINSSHPTFNYRQPIIMIRCIIYSWMIGLQFNNIYEVWMREFFSAFQPKSEKHTKLSLLLFTVPQKQKIKK